MESDTFPPTSETTVMHQEDDLFTPKQCLCTTVVICRHWRVTKCTNEQPTHHTHTHRSICLFFPPDSTLAPYNPNLWHHQLLVFLI